MTRPSDRWRELIAGDFLESSAAGFAAPFVAATGPGSEAGETPGILVGRYRLLQEIGRGGMGTVWLAKRADGHFDQQVALKLIKRGMDSDEILARFLRERQILARLEHPHIGRLLDGGMSDDGRPYFVMELVQGETLTRYCDARRLGIEERLRLFALVCRAVHYAHQSLVVHRDLKPSNVLVTEAGEIKLLDFGVARLLGEEGADELTAPGRMLTPEYASPEQLTGGRVTTASDVYQLGILLYELLTGRRPFANNPLSRDREPGHPSTEVGRVATLVHRDGRTETIEPASVGERRNTTSARLRRRLRGDLDAIALRALRAEPDRRYPSAAALGEDVERHLAHLPIRFGSAGWRYRSGRFVRRYRLRLAALGVFVLVSITAGALYLVRIRTERDRAQRESAKAAESAALLGRFFQGWSPDAADRGRISAEAVLGDAVDRAERELSQDPEMLAAVLSGLGDLYSGLGKSPTADTLLTRALAIQERLPGRAEYDLAATLARRGRLFRGLGRYREAEGNLRRALDLYRRLLPEGRPELLRTQYDLATVLTPQERAGEAEILLRDALDHSPNVEAPFTTEVMSTLGYALFRQARYREASELLRATLQRQLALFGELHVSTLRTLRGLASSLRDWRDLPEAEALYRRAFAISRTLFGEDHPETAGTSTGLAILLERKGDFPEAERLVRQALWLPDTGTATIELALRYRTLGGLRLAQGALAEADSVLRHALVMLSIADADHPDQGDIRNRLAYLVFRRGDPDSSAVYDEAVRFERSRPKEGPFFITDGYEYLAWAARRRGDLALATTLYRRAVELYRRELPEQHSYRKQAEAGLRELGIPEP